MFGFSLSKDYGYLGICVQHQYSMASSGPDLFQYTVIPVLLDALKI